MAVNCVFLAYIVSLVASKMDTFHLPKLRLYVPFQPVYLFENWPYVHCKCLQGFTGTLRGNECAGVSNLQGLQVTCNACKKI